LIGPARSSGCSWKIVAQPASSSPTQSSADWQFRAHGERFEIGAAIPGRRAVCLAGGDHDEFGQLRVAGGGDVRRGELRFADHGDHAAVPGTRESVHAGREPALLLHVGPQLPGETPGGGRRSDLQAVLRQVPVRAFGQRALRAAAGTEQIVEHVVHDRGGRKRRLSLSTSHICAR
jgi:hypothetical protein